MFKFSRYAQDTAGNIQTSGTATVNISGAGLATIYSDNAGTPKANPFSIPSTGLVEFYLANQRFDVEAVTPAGTITLLDQLAFDVDEQSGNITVADTLTVQETLAVTGVATFSADVVLADVTATSDFSSGYKGLPIVTLDASGDVLASYAGKTVRHTSGSAHAYTIQPNATIAHRVGAAIVLRNIGAGAVTITRGSGVALRLAGSSTDGNLTLNQWGMVTLVQEATDVWVASGTL